MSNPASFFYNATTSRYIALFGSMFNKITIERKDESNAVVQRQIVPIAYGPTIKFLSRIKQDPELDSKPAIVLPRLAFFITSIAYDGERKIGSLKKYKLEGGQHLYSGAPYNLNFDLAVMTKFAGDAHQIVEQIMPFFKPERTHSVELIPGLPPLDISVSLDSVTTEDLYEAAFTERRSIVWTLSFTLKGWYFGPVRESNLIRFVDIRHAGHLDPQRDPDTVQQTYPGLTSTGQPTTNPGNAIPWEDVEEGDDWAPITVTEAYDEDIHDV